MGARGGLRGARTRLAAEDGGSTLALPKTAQGAIQWGYVFSGTSLQIMWQRDLSRGSLRMVTNASSKTRGADGNLTPSAAHGGHVLSASGEGRTAAVPCCAGIAVCLSPPGTGGVPAQRAG
jgi:hypothetical protein